MIVHTWVIATRIVSLIRLSLFIWHEWQKKILDRSEEYKIFPPCMSFFLSFLPHSYL